MNLSNKILRDRYLLRKHIASGGMSDLYRAEDRETGDMVAVKVLRPEGVSNRAEDLVRYQMVLECIKSLDHPNIVKILDYGLFGDAGSRHFIVMDLVQGQNLEEMLQEGRGFSLEESLSYIRDVCRALEAVHALKVMHGDLKPGNVLCPHPASGPHSIKLIDFGLARMRDFGQVSESGYIAGTFRYMSPEQAGIIRHPVDQRSDLYSLGIILYRMITGRLPFEGVSLIELMHQQAAKMPDAPSALVKEVPIGLDRIALRLLEKEPERRYQTAAGLLHDLELLLEGKSDFEIGRAESTASHDFTTEMIGRSAELSRMKEALSNIGSGGRLCCITGEAGIGKSRLVDEFRKEVLRQGIPYIEGRAMDRENKTPFEPVRDAVTDYMRLFRRYPDARKKAVSEAVLKECFDLGRIIIDFNIHTGELLGQCPPIVSLEPEREMQRFYLTMARFLLSLSKAEGGIVLMLEDMHWADEGSLKVLEELAGSLVGLPILIVAAFRDAEVPDNHILHAMNRDESSVSLPVKRFAQDDMVGFLKALFALGRDDAVHLGRLLIQRSGGNPFFAIEIAKKLVDGGAVVREGRSWRLDRRKLEGVAFPETLIEAILDGMDDLTADERLALTRASAVGRAFTMELLAGFESAGSGELSAMKDLLETIESAAAKGLIEEDYLEPGSYSFVHDRVRDALYSSIKDDERKSLHRQLGFILEEKYRAGHDSVIFDLAGHFIEAEDILKIEEYGYAAGIAARRCYAHEEAVVFFTNVINVIYKKICDPDNDHYLEMYNQCRFEIAEISNTIGNIGKAITIIDEMLEDVTSVDKRYELYYLKTIALFKSGDFKGCELSASEGLAYSKIKLPFAKHDVILFTIRELLFHMIYSIIPFRGIKASRTKEKYKLAIWYLYTLHWAYFFSNLNKELYVILRMLNISTRKIGISSELILSQLIYANVIMTLPMLKRSKRYIDKSYTMIQEIGDERMKALYYQVIGYYHFFTGRFNDCIANNEMSKDLLIKIGDRHDVARVNHYIIMCDYFQSNYGKAYSLYEESMRESVNIFDELALVGFGFPAEYFIEVGEYKKAEELLTHYNRVLEEMNILYLYCYSCGHLSYLYSEKEDFKKALEFFEETESILSSNFFPPFYISVFYARYLDFLIEIIKLDKISLNISQVFLQKKIKKIFRAVKKYDKPEWTYHHGIKLRALGKYFCLINRNDRAEKYFLLSIHFDSIINRRYELARTLYEYGLFLKEQNREVEAWHRLAESYRIFEEIGALPYKEKIARLLGLDASANKDEAVAELLRREKLARIAIFIKGLASFHEKEALLDEVLNSAMELTGARSGYLFLSEEVDQPPAPVASSHMDTGRDEEYSRSIVSRVFDTGEPVLTTNAEVEKEFTQYKSVFLYGLKSVICVPVKHNDLVNGVLYLDNDLASGVFSNNHIDLLEELLSNAALAIENMLLRERLKEQGKKKKSAASLRSGDPILSAALGYMELNYTEEITREDLADELGISADYLGKIIKVNTGKTVRDYLNEVRIKHAVELLSATDDRIIDIAFAVGFESLRTFYRIFFRVMGETPTGFRERNR